MKHEIAQFSSERWRRPSVMDHEYNSEDLFCYKKIDPANSLSLGLMQYKMDTGLNIRFD